MQSDREHVINDLKNTNTELPFEIICDNDQKIYNMLCIEAAQSGEELLGNRGDDLKAKGAAARAAGFAHGDYEGNELQLPAMFIVNEDGVVEYANYARNIVDLPTVDEVLAML
jgi:peroxiredoxin